MPDPGSSKKATQESKADAGKASKSSVVVESGVDNSKTEPSVAPDSSKKKTQEAKSDAVKGTKTSVVVESGADNSKTATTVASGGSKRVAHEAKLDAAKVTKSSVLVETSAEKSKTETTVVRGGGEEGSGVTESKTGKEKGTSGEAKSNECTVEIELGETPNRRSLRSSAGRKSTGLSDSKKSSEKVSPASKSGKPKCEVSVSFD